MTNEPLRGQPSPQGDKSGGQTGSSRSLSASVPDSAAHAAAASGKPLGTRFGLSNYRGLALALVAEAADLPETPGVAGMRANMQTRNAQQGNDGARGSA